MRRPSPPSSAPQALLALPLSLALSLSGLACVTGAGSPGSDGTGGSDTSTAGTTGTNGTGGKTTTGGGGSTTPTGTGGSGTTTGTGGNTTPTGGRTGAGGTTGTAGTTGAGGTITGTGGAAPPFTPPFPCTIPTWPTPTGTPVNITSTMNVTGTYDGHMALHSGSGSGDFAKNCNASGTGAQGTTTPLFQLANGATIQNVIIGTNGADGIHCAGTCTIKNVWWQYVCDDAVTAADTSSGTVTIQGGGARGAHDKLFQDNSHGKFIIDGFYGEKLGKMYRACGAGGACGSTKGNLTLSNSWAIGVDEVVGLTMGRDTATISKLCVFQSPTICQPYNSSDSKLATDGNDGVTCKYAWADVQVMLDHAVPAGFTTASACPNYFKSSSSTAAGTACLADLPACMKYCAPGSNGLKQCNCVSGSYSCKGCAGPALEPAKSGLAPTKAATAPTCTVASNASCPTEWNWCINGTQDCVCVYKPGTLQTANTVWDCVNPWY
jgi:hypothetical protein